MHRLRWELGVPAYSFIQKIYTEYVKIRYAKRKETVFCIGDSRTGTTSLTLALRKLGIPTIHWPLQDQEPKEGWIEWTRNSPFAEFSDYPYARHSWFKKLDEEFPRAKFILTTREAETWKKSVYTFFENTPHEKTRHKVEEWNKRRVANEEQAKTYFSNKSYWSYPWNQIINGGSSATSYKKTFQINHILI